MKRLLVIALFVCVSLLITIPICSSEDYTLDGSWRLKLAMAEYEYCFTILSTDRFELVPVRILWDNTGLGGDRLGDVDWYKGKITGKQIVGTAFHRRPSDCPGPNNYVQTPMTGQILDGGQTLILEYLWPVYTCESRTAQFPKEQKRLTR